MYIEHYGFRESPFQITPDPRFLFLTRSHRDALSYLRYGIEERRGILVLTGEVGVGKTLLVRSLLEQLSREVETAVVMNARLTFQQLLYMCLLDLGVPPKGKAKVDMLLSLQEYLLRLKDQGRTALFVVDEAQTLSIESLEEIRLLSNLETSTEKLLQVLLVGQPELKAVLSQHALRQLRQRIPGICDVTRLPRESVGEYIEHRLHVAGEGRCGGMFTEAAIDEVARYSGGIPRMVNQVCDRALLLGYARGADLIDDAHARDAIQELESGFTSTPVPEDGDSRMEKHA